MKRITNSKLRMYRNVRLVIEANQESWVEIPAFESAVTQFHELLTELADRLNERRQVLFGAKQNHDVTRKELESEIYFMAKLIHAYAKSTGDLKLIEASKATRSDLYRQRMSALIPLAEVMLTFAAAHQPAIADYGVDQTRMDDLEAAKNRFEIYIDAPRQAIVLRKTMVKAIDITVRKIDKVLKSQLDALIHIVEKTDPMFFSNYFNARTVIDSRGKSRISEATTIDFFDNEITPGNLNISPPEDDAA